MQCVFDDFNHILKYPISQTKHLKVTKSMSEERFCDKDSGGISDDYAKKVFHSDLNISYIFLLEVLFILI